MPKRRYCRVPVHNCGRQMATTKAKNGTPLPRSLATIGAIRREMVTLYRDAKAGKHDVQLVGRLVHLLNSLVALDRDHGFEERLDRLEGTVEQIKANGHGPHARV
jgi:hypothetical protein